MTQIAIGFPELEKSSLVLYDMAAFYLPLYERDWEDFFKCQALLGMTEALIYQVEIAIDQGQSFDWSQQAERIRYFLGQHVTITAPMESRLADLGKYFHHVQALRASPSMDIASVLATAELRPADIRLLHQILLQYFDLSFDAELFDLLVPLEVLVDLKANLSEYQQDLASGHHNVYHCFVRQFGHEAPAHFTKQQDHYRRLLDDRLAKASSANCNRLAGFAARHERAYPSPLMPSP